jgi:hypothetical protein
MLHLLKILPFTITGVTLIMSVLLFWRNARCKKERKRKKKGIKGQQK